MNFMYESHIYNTLIKKKLITCQKITREKDNHAFKLVLTQQ